MYEKIDKNLYTPMMRQYLEIKENYPDTLVFFRLGDFYEMFFNDALVASRELEIVLTGRDAGVGNEKVPMCGVPYHAVDSYIEKLSNKGYKVAIVEQLEEPGGKKIVHRDVTKIVTPGTNIDEKYLSDKNNNYIGAIEKLDNGYAFAYIDLSTGESKIAQFPNNFDLIYGEISKLSIKEVVSNKNLNQLVCNNLTKNLGVLVSICEDNTLDSYLDSLYVNLPENIKVCAKRLLAYIVKTQKRVLVHLQPFAYYDSKDYLRLDNNVVRNLELVESLKGNRFKNNLFSVLDKCSTAMGSRFLKRSILFPLVDLKAINERHDFIDELAKNGLIVEEVKKDLMEIYDLERIVGRISYGNLNPKDLIQLKRSIGVLPSIKDNLNKINGKVAKKKANQIITFDELYDLLNKSIDESAGFSLKDGGVIKAGYSEELDKIKNISSTNKDFLINLEKREKEKTGIKNLKVGYNKVFGYYIEVTKSYLNLIKDEFGYIRKQTTSNSERYITEELKEREALILRSDERSIELESELFNEIRNICKEYASKLQKVAQIVSEIDMLIAFNIVAKTNNYVRPTFSLYDELEIVGGRHPVIEVNLDKPFIPNDLILYNNDKILLITGPNMSGKSTYMRQNAIIAIMAQMGSFVPATYAKLPTDVTLRAQDLLEKLEAKSNIDQKTLSIENYHKPIVQVVEKNTKEADDVLNLLKSLNPDDMKPIDALVALSKLKAMVNEDE